jgi:hypothetical protein
MIEVMICRGDKILSPRHACIIRSGEAYNDVTHIAPHTTVTFRQA